MKVSIIIRTLNEEKYLPECLEAINRQNFEGKTEVIVVDSGSNDRTLEICADHKVKIIKIRAIDNFSFIDYFFLFLQVFLAFA